MKNRSFSAKLLFPIAFGTLVGILLLVGSTTLWSIQNNTKLTKEYLIQEGHVLASGLANAVAKELVQKDYGALERRLLQSASSLNIISALVIDMRGNVFGYVLGSSGGKPPRSDFSLKHIMPPSNYTNITQEIEAGILTVWHKVNIGTDIGWVRIEISTEQEQQYVSLIQKETLILAVIITILGILFLGGAILRSYRLLSLQETKEEHRRIKLENKAYYDSLTHLPNRSLLFDRFEQAIATHKRNNNILAICFIDLDKFKLINDNYGHDVGDEVLKEVAKRLSSAIRGGDTVARLGGDEFIVLLCELKNEEEAKNTIERLMDKLNKPMGFEGNKLDILASIGYVLYPNDSSDEESLIQLADKVM